MIAPAAGNDKPDFEKNAMRYIGFRNVPEAEAQIEEGIYHMLTRHRMVLEGAGAAGPAALLSGVLDIRSKTAAVILTGNGIDPETLFGIIGRERGWLSEGKDPS
jgi:threonine dehydratase